MSLINKEETLTKLRVLRERWGSTLTARGIIGAIKVVENMEDASIAETNVSEASAPTTALTSYWIETESVTTSKNGRETRSKDYTCANCKTSNGKKKANYCSNCGADMRGSDDE